MQQKTNSADTNERKNVADHLYINRGPKEASSRCDANAKFGDFDLCDEMLRRLDLRAGMCSIDVGCGTGQHVVRYRDAVGAKGTARGFDFSPEAIAQARKRGVQAEVADGAALPIADAYADRVSSSYSIYYMPDLDKTLAEWRRVLKPGGRLVVCGPADDTNRELYEFHRGITGKGPADVDQLSLGYVATRLPPTLRKLGFTDVLVETLTNPIRFPTVNEFVDYWVATSLFARGVPEADRARVIAEGRTRLHGHDGFTITKRISIVTATRA